MLTLEERAELLGRANELTARNDFVAVHHLLADCEPDEIINEPELGYLLALALTRLRRLPSALEIVRRLAVKCERDVQNRLQLRRMNLEGVIWADFGNTTTAEQLFRDVFSRAVRAGDQLSIAFSTMNLGAVSTIRGEWVPALVALKHAVAAFHETGDDYALGGCHQNLALAYRRAGHFEQAESHRQVAARYYAISGGARDLEFTALDVERAMLFLDCGDLVLAEVTARSALARLTASMDQPWSTVRDEGEVRLVLGLVALGKENWDLARAELTRALHCASHADNVLLMGEAHEAFFSLDLGCGRTKDAQNSLSGALNCYERLQAPARTAALLEQATKLGALPPHFGHGD